MLLSQANVTDLQDLKRRGVKLSYSQLGEDMILTALMTHDNGFYVDAGCHDPHRYSNTALLHLYRNWSGINIDANPKAIAKFQAERPHDINLNFGVSDAPSEMEFTVFKGGIHSSFDAKMIEAAQTRVEIEQRISVEVRTLKSILDEFLPAGRDIDYMNIDCEGFDAKVLAGNDWTKYRPKYLSVEIHGFNFLKAAEHPVVKMLVDNGYRIRAHCIATSIFERVG